ncbi:hypothetical protein ACQ4PT_012028 [Festuca glaucescens]
MGSPSSSSQLRRWADYTDDEEEVSPRSYCEVLRSGMPPVGASSRAPPPSPAGGGVGPSSSAPRGVVPPAGAAPRPWAVDDSVRRLASMVVQPRRAPTSAARAPACGAASWTDVRGRKRACNQQAMLPTWTIRSGLPTNLAGACFNCTRTYHISVECTYETVCLRCGEEGHHARACPQNRRGERGLGPVAPSGLPAHQRLGPRELEPATTAGRSFSPPVSREPRVEGGAGKAPELPVEEGQLRYRIPAHQRLGLGSSPPRRVRTPSPAPVESAGSRIPAHQRARGRARRHPPPTRETAGSSSCPPVRGRSPGAGSRGRGDAAGERPRDACDARGSDSAERYPRPAEDAHIHGGRSGSRPRQESSARGVVVGRVFVPRSEEITAAEAVLRYALVAFVSGKRAYVTLSEAGAALAERVPRAADNFTVHRSWPADFLFVCSSRRVRDEVMAADAAHGCDFSLRFLPWNHQLQAMQCRMRYRAHFELQGVPAHAWNRTTATAVLSSDAWLECLGTSTANREDLGLFRVVAWTNDLSAFPKAMEMLIEEPDDKMEEDEGLVLPGVALIPLEKNMLRYQVAVCIAHVEDMIPVEEEDDDRRDDGAGGDGDGLSDRDDGCGRSRPHGDGGRQEERERGHGRDGPRDQSCARRGDALRRHPPGSGWGGSRHVAINTAMEVTPWLEVEDEDVEREARPALGPTEDRPLSTPVVPRCWVEEDDWEEGECRTIGSFESDSDRDDSNRFRALRWKNCQLPNDGLLSPPASSLQCGSPLSSSDDSAVVGSPRSVLETFPISVSPADKTHPTVRPLVVDPASQSLSVDFVDFRNACRKPISPVLDVPAKKCRKNKTYVGPVRRSGRIRGRLAAGAPIRQQQRTLMTRLGIAREGEVIGDDALDAYLDLFDRPL